MKQLERILVPVDYSEHSRLALEHALALAERFGASIDVLNVWTPPTYFSPELTLGMPGWSAIPLEQYAREEAAKDMERFLADFKGRGIPLKSEVDIGRPGATILRHADKASLIVMGTHGLTGIGRLLLGSIAQEVVAKAPCPVLTVKLPDSRKQ